MKKITFLLIAFMAIIFCACSSDDDESKSRQFIYADDSLVVSMSGERNLRISIFKNKECVYQNLYNMTVSGDYPVYTYTYKDYENGQLQLVCTYSNPSTFTAIVEQCNIVGQIFFPHYKGEIIILPSTMLFKANNKILDANGDGILDE